MEIEVCVPPGVWSQIRLEMLRQRGGDEEVFGYIFASSHRLSGRTTRLVFRDYVVPTRDMYTEQSPVFLKLSQRHHIEMLNRFVRRGFSVIHLHTHPGQEAPHFSGLDDVNEESYARFLNGYRSKAIFVSGVFNKDMSKSCWRSWQLDRQRSFYNVRHGRKAADVGTIDLERFSRQEVFGSSFQKELGSLSVTLIGCGGIGSIFAEQLTRLGVRKWTLVDPDVIEKSNLNRLPFATDEDVGRTKVDYVSSLIRRAAVGRPRVRHVTASIGDSRARRLAAESELIVVATDNHYSRVVAQEISSRFSRRLISLASHIDLHPGEKPRFFARVTSPPLRPNSWSLLSAGAVSAVKAAEEIASVSVREELRQHGYLADVPAPAVYWLNGIAASLGVSVVHKLQLGDELAGGLDRIFDVANDRFLSVAHDDAECLYSSNKGEGLFGAGHLRLS